MDAEVWVCEDFISEAEFEKFETAITEAIQRVSSLEELESWLRSQPCMEFVRLENYVIKTFPPRREFRLGMRMEGGAVRQKILTIILVGNDQFELHGMREPN